MEKVGNNVAGNITRCGCPLISDINFMTPTLLGAIVFSYSRTSTIELWSPFVCLFVGLS